MSVFASSLAVAERLGRVESAGSARVMRWPHNPSYFGGNALVLAAAPDDADRAALEAAFARAFPDAEHVALYWPGERVPRWPSYEVTAMIGLSADRVAGDVEPERLHPADRIAWDRVRALRQEILGVEADSPFLAGVVADARTVAEAAWGAWVAVRRGGEVVADAGLVETPWGTRLQEVQVRRDWRGKGVGTELLRGLGALAARRWPGRPLLLEAEADNPAALALYRKVGFREVERTGSAFRRPGST